MKERSYRPVVVEMAHFVCEPLHVVRFESTGVVDDVEVGWSDCSLADTLACQEEIIPAHTHTDTNTHMNKNAHTQHTQ